MAEIQFAKSFLASLDGRPIKLSTDYAEDPRKYPARPPYILPRMPRPMHKPAATTATTTTSSTSPAPVPGQEPRVTVSVRSLHRNPHPLDLDDLGAHADPPLALATTSLFDIRSLLADLSGIPRDKLRLLFRKKPIADSKVLQDLVDGGDGPLTIELAVMVSGGAATVAAGAEVLAEKKLKAKEAAAAANNETARFPATLAEPVESTTTTNQTGPESEAFWNELHAFLAKRLPSDKHADEIFSLFLQAWNDRMD